MFMAATHAPLHGCYSPLHGCYSPLRGCYSCTTPRGTRVAVLVEDEQGGTPCNTTIFSVKCNTAPDSPTNNALRATRATFETLAERLSAGEAHDLAAQLPRELGRFLERNDDNNGERFGLDEFLNRVCTRETVDKPAGIFHARVVVEVLQEAVSAGEIRDVMAQLPHEYTRLFAAGSEGAM